MPKKNKKTKKQLIKEADDAFSEYMRLKNSDWRGNVACYTCGAVKYWQKDGMQNGHFIKRDRMSLRYSEDNCRPQCVGCNIFRNGNYIEFTLRMIRDIGIDGVDELKRIGNEIRQLTEGDIEEIRDKYRELAAKIKIEKGL